MDTKNVDKYLAVFGDERGDRNRDARIAISDEIRKEIQKALARVSRQHLKANGFPAKEIKKLSNGECIFVANQHMRAFLGMDQPNIFTNRK